MVFPKEKGYYMFINNLLKRRGTTCLLIICGLSVNKAASHSVAVLAEDGESNAVLRHPWAVFFLPGWTVNKMFEMSSLQLMLCQSTNNAQRLHPCTPTPELILTVNTRMIVATYTNQLLVRKAKTESLLRLHTGILKLLNFLPPSFLVSLRELTDKFAVNHYIQPLRCKPATICKVEHWARFLEAVCSPWSCIFITLHCCSSNCRCIDKVFLPPKQ